MKNLDSIEFVKYTKTEEILNSVTHIFGAILALVASFLCVERSISLYRWDYLAIGLVMSAYRSSHGVVRDGYNYVKLTKYNL